MTRLPHKKLHRLFLRKVRGRPALHGESWGSSDSLLLGNSCCPHLRPQRGLRSELFSGETEAVRPCLPPESQGSGGFREQVCVCTCLGSEGPSSPRHAVYHSCVHLHNQGGGVTSHRSATLEAKETKYDKVDVY